MLFLGKELLFVVYLKVDVLTNPIERSWTNYAISTAFSCSTLVVLLELLLSYEHGLNLVKFELIVVAFGRRRLTRFHMS